jgi:TRAP-type C4-dicarboxylate transport system substrate-binding protein
MRRFYIIPLLVVILSALILVGCSSPVSSPTSQPTAQAPTSKPATSVSATSSAPVTSSVPASSTAPAPSTSTAGKVIELRFAHQNPPQGRTTVKYLNVYAQQIEQATKGKVKITMYPAESLAPANQMVQAVQGGVADITWSQLGYYTNRFPLTSVMALPFMNLPSAQVNGKPLSGGGIDSRIIEELYETVPEIQTEWKEFKVLYLQSSDPFWLFTSKKAVHNMSDLSGMKIRDLGGYPSDMWKALGASPLTLNMPDVYDALQKGIIDGANVSLAAVTTYKIYEAAKFYTDAPTTTSPQFVIMNKDTWNSLPKDVQDGIMSVSGIPGAEFSGESAFGADVKTDLLAQVQKGGFTLQQVSLDTGEFDKWKQIAGKPIWDKWVADMNAKGLPGQKVMDAALALINKYK